LFRIQTWITNNADSKFFKKIFVVKSFRRFKNVLLFFSQKLRFVELILFANWTMKWIFCLTKENRVYIKVFFFLHFSFIWTDQEILFLVVLIYFQIR
jgi:hypothetical protein